ncbi:hypothetical protein RCH10_001955 [Variovorax sp. GrIS 2.14]|uniref:hypothetical protein n=1 Tax=Variovorax sp. GrIS 2.14 TaxID=3071709 RepID=UPI0038F6F4C9
MKRLVIVSPLLLLAACASSGLSANGIHSLEVSSPHRFALRTTAILEASRQCRENGKRVDILQVDSSGLTPFTNLPEAEAVFRCD